MWLSQRVDDPFPLTSSYLFNKTVLIRAPLRDSLEIVPSQKMHRIISRYLLINDWSICGSLIGSFHIWQNNWFNTSITYSDLSMSRNMGWTPHFLEGTKMRGGLFNALPNIFCWASIGCYNTVKAIKRVHSLYCLLPNLSVGYDFSLQYVFKETYS